MVKRVCRAAILCTGPLLAHAQKLPITKLDPESRARAIGLLVLLTIGGVALVVLSWLALRVGRRQARREDQRLAEKERKLNMDDWAEKPLLANRDSSDGLE